MCKNCDAAMDKNMTDSVALDALKEVIIMAWSGDPILRLKRDVMVPGASENLRRYGARHKNGFHSAVSLALMVGLDADNEPTLNALKRGAIEQARAQKAAGNLGDILTLLVTAARGLNRAERVFMKAAALTPSDMAHEIFAAAVCNEIEDAANFPPEEFGDNTGEFLTHCVEAAGNYSTLVL